MNRKPIFETVKALRGDKPFTPEEVQQLDAAIDEACGLTKPAALEVPQQFYSVLRGHYGGFEQPQIDGLNCLLSEMGKSRWPLSWCAYGLATTWHETNGTMQPVREAYWLSEQWRKNNLRYYPWYGRGYVQLTWEPNYKRASEELGLNGQLIANPDLALQPDIAARVLVHGMEAGWFTNKKLSDYLPLAGGASYDAYTAARRIINGQDKAQKIAKHAQAFEAALVAGGWN